MSDGLNRPLVSPAEEQARAVAARANGTIRIYGAEEAGQRASAAIEARAAAVDARARDPLGGITDSRITALENDVAKLKTLLVKVMPYLDNLRRGRNISE